MTSSVGAPHKEASQFRGGGEGSPGSRQLVQELIEEKTKLFEENKKLGQRWGALHHISTTVACTQNLSSNV